MSDNVLDMKLTCPTCGRDVRLGAYAAHRNAEILPRGEIVSVLAAHTGRTVAEIELYAPRLANRIAEACPRSAAEVVESFQILCGKE